MIGTKLGPYEITAKLGEGGMGEVYRATDTRLGREVAIKVLPESVAQDPERLARFEREAKILASLNHNNIATIFGLEEGGSAPALVMELVEGPTLGDRIAQGPLPLDEALPIAKQIAEGLEYAHERGIIHRDLKPANIKLTAEGQVKILDFGLAKALEVDTASGGAVDLSHSPTLAYQATVQGLILGTAAYMSPEQAAGKPVDKRSDIWAFGVVLYEMLTGAQLFEGDSAAETLAGVLKGEINLDSLPVETPASIRRLLRRCLERNPKNRLHDIADARIAIDEVMSGEVEAESKASIGERKPWIRVAPWLLVAALVAVVGWLGLVRGGPKQASGPRALEISLPPGYLLNAEAAPAIAPDGRAVVFGASDATHASRLFLRRLDRFDVTPLEGTEGATFPFWSPDSKSIAFYRNFGLLRYDLATQSTQVILKTGALPRGGSWSRDGTILFAPSANSPIQRITASGGSPQDVTKLDPSILDGSHRFPVFLPDGKRFLMTIWSNNLKTASRVGGVYLASLDKGIERRLTPDHSEAILAGDRLLVYREGDLVALPFDPDTATVEGAGEIVSEDALYSSSSGALAASASAAGDLAFAVSSGEGSGELAWLDRKGKLVGRLAVERMAMDWLTLAPDGRHFAVLRNDASGGDVWVGDSDRQIMARLTRGTSDSYSPIWSPDGRQIAFSTEATGQESVYVQPADGSQAAELLLAVPKYDVYPTEWAAGGRYLFIGAIDRESQRREIWLYDFEKRAKNELLSDPSASVGDGILSPDGRWLAYVSDESGNPEVFVRPYPALDRKWQVSQGGAERPHWRNDGREIIFVATSDRSVQSVSVEPTNDGLSFGAPEALFTPQSPLLALAPAPDHSRFLVGIVPGDVRSEPIHLILGWSAHSIGGAR